ncbi:MAG TPA: PEGA domain-containing protein [Thermotogota bacterium]|nr:PEGA domain-containing protein [Thermotogota bacterium]HRW94005.1 PEGA domain-containing protein [Thermotogota bacterium]
MKKNILLWIFLGIAGVFLAQFCPNWIDLHESGSDFRLNATLQTGAEVGSGQWVRLWVRVNHPAFVAVVGCAPDGKQWLLYPSKLYPVSLLSANRTHSLYLGMTGTEPLHLPGQYRLMVLASTSLLTLFDDFKSLLDESIPVFPQLDTGDPRWLFPSRMQASMEWEARNLSFAFSQPMGKLGVMSYPIGASLYLDGEFVALTPYEVDVTPGTHALQLRLDGFQDFTESVLVGSGHEVVRNVFLQPQPDKKNILVDSFPQGAEVRVDGKVVGTTPMEYTLDYGTHVINLFKDGYYNYAKLITVSGSSFNEPLNQALEVTQFVGNPQARLTFDVVPANAQVYLDGILQKNREVFPMPGRHVVQVKMEGYASYEREIDLEPQQRMVLPVQLVPSGIRLQVLVNNTVAEVFVNGVSYGLTPFSVELPEGRYDVTLVSAGYESWTKTVTLRQGRPETLEVQMKALKF